MLYAVSDWLAPGDGEESRVERVRYRTVGDMSVPARSGRRRGTLETIIDQVATARVTERGETRADDRTSDAAMEDRKREGYF